jgi:hypothetical protein
VSIQEPNSGPVSVAPDNIAASLLGGRPAIPDGYVSFKAYLDVPHDGLQRAYENDGFVHWWEIKVDDIAGRLDPPPNQQDPRTIVWVKRDARITRCEVGSAQEMADRAGGGDPDNGRSTQARVHPPW